MRDTSCSSSSTSLIAELHRELSAQTRTVVFAVVFSLLGALAGIGGLALALSRLLR